MRKPTVLALVAAVLALAGIAASQTFTYVGAAKCALCHKTEKQGRQVPIWEGGKHSKSFAALGTPEAAAAGQALGVSKPAEDPKCLKCHAPLFEKAPDVKAEGVTCEVCHGPGSAYKSLSVMKNREESAKNGLILYDSPDKIKARCLTCHENAHGKTFDFAARWEKVKHGIPGK